MTSQESVFGDIHKLPRAWVDRLFEAMVEGGTDSFWRAVAELMLDAFRDDVLVVWEAFSVTLFRRSADGEIVAERNSPDGNLLRAPALYNAFNLEFSADVRQFDDEALGKCDVADHRYLAPHRPLHACSVDFMQGSWVHCALALHGPARLRAERNEMFDRIVPIVQRLFLGEFERQKQTAVGVGLAAYLRDLPVGLIMVDWFFNVLMVNDEGYRHSVLWNDAPKRGSTKNARARFEIAPDILRGWQELRAQWIERLRTGLPAPPPLVVINAQDAKLRATTGLVVAGGEQTATPCFMARFSSIQTRALDQLFEATPQQMSILSDLTPAERAVALLVREGLSNRDIADRLGRQVWTIKSHLTSIFSKTATRSRSELIRLLHLHKAGRR